MRIEGKTSVTVFTKTLNMEMQSVFHGIPPPKLRLSAHRLLSRKLVLANHVRLKNQALQLGSAQKLYMQSGLTGGLRGLSMPMLKRVVVMSASGSNSSGETDLKPLDREVYGVPATVNNDGVEPFSGKSGSVSFCGMTHQSVEEGGLMSAPLNVDKSSFLWLLGPVTLISSLIVPQFFLGQTIEAFLKDTIFTEIVTSLSFEAMFYVGLATFLLVTDQIQRPYLQFSPKRWSLITGLRGYLTSAFFAMGFKVIVPLFVVYVTWPMLGLPALVAVVPFLVGCISQRAFEAYVDKRSSSCWPLVPIIFEVYRIYQLTKAAFFIEKLMFNLRSLPESAQLMERQSALFAMIVTFQVLGVVCLWSLLTFLLRLFPSRPVAENY